MNLRGKGKQMGEDIPAYLNEQLDYRLFLRSYGVEVVRIVENNFKEEILDILEQTNNDLDKAQPLIQSVRSKIALFCAAFA